MILKLTNKLDLGRGEKSIALSNLNSYYTWKNIKMSYNSNTFNVSAPTWNDKFEFPSGYILYLIQDYFEYLLKKHGENIDNLSIRVYVNNKENRITFKIKTEYYLELLTMKLLGSTENKITKNQK